jgi:hypothetical protein
MSFCFAEISPYPFYWGCIGISCLYRGYTRVPFLISWIRPDILSCIMNTPENIPYVVHAFACPWMNVYIPECFLCSADTSGCSRLVSRIHPDVPGISVNAVCSPFSYHKKFLPSIYLEKLKITNERQFGFKVCPVIELGLYNPLRLNTRQ